jgi:hypothetical protein
VRKMFVESATKHHLLKAQGRHAQEMPRLV